jgi:hypothetical protein
MNVPSRPLVRYSEPLVWTAALIGIPAWIAHLIFEAAMTPYTTAHPGWRWTMHLATVVTALVTIAGMTICFDLMRAANRGAPPGRLDADDASAANLSRFLGTFGLLIGVANLALILMEGSYVIFVRRGG